MFCGFMALLQSLLFKKPVVDDDDDTSAGDPYRTIKVLERRVETLETELCSALNVANFYRSEKEHAEAAQSAAEIRALEATRDLESIKEVHDLHLEELIAQQGQLIKRDDHIKLLEAIIKTLGGIESLEDKPRITVT